MTPAERKKLQKLDNLVETASPEQLKKIQDIDCQTQMEGLSLYDIYLDSDLLVKQSIRKY